MFFNETLGDLFDMHRPHGRSEISFLAGRSLRPSADVFESPDGIIIKIDVPGISREQIDIRIEGNLLVIGGSREFQRDSADEEYLRLERGFGSFKRAFEVPSDTNPDSIDVRLENGVLTINVPVKHEHRMVNIEATE